ncbi:Uncharacterized protein Fot_02802 [Forsythia ovata]|uniref:Uncharacterized protein n=1 Tax=Forsythia ovata TaxID=205694 RepID=A0ABD1XAZ3_9LAMI
MQEVFRYGIDLTFCVAPTDVGGEKWALGQLLPPTPQLHPNQPTATNHRRWLIHQRNSSRIKSRPRNSSRMSKVDDLTSAGANQLRCWHRRCQWWRWQKYKWPTR